MEPKIITPVMPTFFFDEHGNPHRVNALILKEENLTEDDKQQLDCIDDEGFVMPPENTKDFFTNPKPESYFRDQLRKWFFWCGNIEDLEYDKWYERAVNLGIDLSEFAKNKNQFFEYAEEVYEGYKEDIQRQYKEETN